eukprot:1316208-Amorphochlora_amoeboformis.AAC.1
MSVLSLLLQLLLTANAARITHVATTIDLRDATVDPAEAAAKPDSPYHSTNTTFRSSEGALMVIELGEGMNTVFGSQIECTIVPQTLTCFGGEVTITEETRLGVSVLGLNAVELQFAVRVMAALTLDFPVGISGEIFLYFFDQLIEVGPSGSIRKTNRPTSESQVTEFGIQFNAFNNSGIVSIDNENNLYTVQVLFETKHTQTSFLRLCHAPRNHLAPRSRCKLTAG